MKQKNTYDCIAVTNVEVDVFNASTNLGRIKGLARVVLNDQLIVRGLRIIDSEYGLYVVFPVDPFWKGEDIRCLVQPITANLRKHIEDCVLEKYQEMIAE